MEAISNLKTCKAEGIDRIPAKMPKNLRRTSNEGAYQDLSGNLHHRDMWPEDFLQSIIVPIENRKVATNCEDYRTISLLSQ